MSEINYVDWLKAQFAFHKDKTKSDLANALGLEPPAVSKILNGTRQIKAREYAIMRKFFGLPTTDSIPSLSQRIYTPSNEITPQDFQEPSEDQSEWLIPADFSGLSSQNHKEHYAPFTIRDTHMEPEFKKDEIVIADLLDRLPSTKSRPYIVSDKFSHLVRYCKIVSQTHPQDVCITAANSTFQKQVLNITEFEIIGRVVARLNWLDK